MKAVILAAGLGTRIAKMYPGIPKTLLPIAGKPLLEYHIEHLKQFGFNEFFLNLHFHPLKIKDFLKDGKQYGVKVTYSYEKQILGTSGALKKLKKYLDETFVVLYGDIFTRINFDNFLSFHKNKKSQVTLLVHQTDHPEDSDLVLLDKNGKISNFYTSPHKQNLKNTNLSSAAIYILEPVTLNFLPQKTPNDFIEDFFPILLRKGFRMFGYESDEFSKDIGTPRRYDEVRKLIEDKKR